MGRKQYLNISKASKSNGKNKSTVMVMAYISQSAREKETDLREGMADDRGQISLRPIINVIINRTGTEYSKPKTEHAQANIASNRIGVCVLCAAGKISN